MTRHQSIDQTTETKLRQLAGQVDRAAVEMCSIMHQLCDLFIDLGIDDRQQVDAEELLQNLF